MGFAAKPGVNALTRSTHPTAETAAPRTKMPGAVSRPGTLREFQFHE
jgi:hypothetical protein